MLQCGVPQLLRPKCDAFHLASNFKSAYVCWWIEWSEICSVLAIEYDYIDWSFAVWGKHIHIHTTTARFGAVPSEAEEKTGSLGESKLQGNVILEQAEYEIRKSAFLILRHNLFLRTDKSRLHVSASKQASLNQFQAVWMGRIYRGVYYESRQNMKLESQHS
jgi:hypothetical protein